MVWIWANHDGNFSKVSGVYFQRHIYTSMLYAETVNNWNCSLFILLVRLIKDRMTRLTPLLDDSLLFTILLSVENSLFPYCLWFCFLHLAFLLQILSLPLFNESVPYILVFLSVGIRSISAGLWQLRAYIRECLKPGCWSWSSLIELN